MFDTNHVGTIRVHRSGDNMTLNKEGWVAHATPANDDVVTVFDGGDGLEMTYGQYRQLYG